MEYIGVTGGKGGVGKSTFCVLLAKRLSKDKKVFLVDSDVGCANDHLLLGVKLKNRVRVVENSYPVIDDEKCKRCGLCVEKCRYKALYMVGGGSPKVFAEMCASCGLCWNICPYKAISKEKRVVGEIYEQKINDNLVLVSGVSLGVVEELAPIVRRLKEYVRERVKGVSDGVVVIDSAAGSHCGVIRALWGVDFAYVVTEPTSLGEHDLEVILRLNKKIGILSKVVINRCDLGDSSGIEKIVKNEKVEIVERLKFNKGILGLYNSGRLLEVDEKV